MLEPFQAPVECPSLPVAPKRRRLDAVICQDDIGEARHAFDPLAPSPILSQPMLDDSTMEGRPLSPLRQSVSPNGVSAQSPVPLIGPPACPASPPRETMACPISPRTQWSMDVLEKDSHRLRLEMVRQEQSGKQTKKTYDRHLKSYRDWWERTQAEIAAGDSARVPLPAFPITATKVAHFLQYESTRGKVHIPF